MKEQLWTESIFESYNNIGVITRTIDKRVMSLGVNSYKTSNYGQDYTLSLMDAVIELIEHKKKALKLKVLAEDTLKNIPLNSAKLIIRRYVDKQTLNTLAFEQQKTIGVIRRALKKALSQAYQYFCKCGYCVSNLEKEFSTEKWLVGIYERKYQNLKKPNEEDRIFFIPQKSNSSFSVCFSI